MWLIDVSHYFGHNELIIKEFFHEIPPYAILSHTWTDIELSFDAVRMRPDIVRERAHLKVRFAIEQAKRDDLDYVWIDTCCIDKRSSAELSEAINSMFQWYENAVICYAYLEDLSPSCPSLVELPPAIVHTYVVGGPRSVNELDNICTKESPNFRSKEVSKDYKSQNTARTWTDQLAKCLWFTRGWTLQELIAPRRVYLFGKGWNFVSSRQHLVKTMAEITGISLATLKYGYKSQHISIAKRISWAAKRETTRVEDKAYSLLGILGINMSLLYGEKEKAFERLQKEVMKTSPDCSILCWWRRSREGLLANSPRRFGPSNRITLCEIGFPMIYDFTNRGLSLSLPLLTTTKEGRPERYLAILGCRMEDDYRRLIAIHLRCHGKENILGEESLKCSIEGCTKGCQGAVIESQWSMELHMVRQRRLKAARVCRVIVPNDNFRVIADLNRSKFFDSAVCEIPDSLEIVGAFPDHQWNKLTKTMTKHRSLAAIGDPYHGALHLKHESGAGIMVCFTVHHSERFLDIVGIHGKSPDIVYTEFCRKMKRIKHTREVVVYALRSHKVRAKLRLVGRMMNADSMGEAVHLIQITEKGPLD